MRTLRRLRIHLIGGFTTILTLAWSSMPVGLVRGPYLQSLHATGTKIVFQTASVSSARVHLGRWPYAPWELEFASPAAQMHVVDVDGLLCDTRYYYEVEAGGQALTPEGECSFRTAPPPHARRPFRFLAWGDSGTGTATQMEVAAQMEEVFPVPDLALALGDLIYPNGERENYDPRFFQPYAKLFRTTTIWPTIGNHDVGTQGGAPYLEAFYLPTQSGAPGHPSGTELYYSFDYGMAHFVCVDSQTSSHAVGGAMYQWIDDDLEHANSVGKRWLIVFMHHPPYTRGTHNSDVETELILLRQHLVPLFESRGVDLVLTGHSHVYERSFLARNDAVLQTHPNTYTKYGSPDGTLYLVNGCGGASGSGSLDHPLMAHSAGNVEGVNVFDVSFDEIHGSFVEGDGRTTDLFTVRKAPDTEPPRLLAVRTVGADELQLAYDEPVLGGSGAFGAEALGNYAIVPNVPLLDATLLSDQRTVVLTLAPAPTEVARAIEVLRVEDTTGQRGSAAALFVQETTAGPVPVAPVPVLAVDRHTGNVPTRVQFDGARSFDDDGSIVAATWDFGDGSPRVSGPAATHVYGSEGLYTATLIVQDDAGLDALATQAIRVHGVGVDPLANLVATSTQIQAGGFVDFDGRGSLDPDGGPVYLVWDFGDPDSGAANHSTHAAVRHVFAAHGTYQVTLTVADDEGSAVTATTSVEVEAGPSDSSGGGACSAPTLDSSGKGDGSLPCALALVFWILWRRQRAVAELRSG